MGVNYSIAEEKKTYVMKKISYTLLKVQNA